MFRLLYDTSKNLKKDRERLVHDQTYTNKIRTALEAFQKDPFGDAFNIKKLEPKSDDVYRLRIGEYRMIFSVDFGNKIIIIHRIEKRKDVYK